MSSAVHDYSSFFPAVPVMDVNTVQVAAGYTSLRLQPGIPYAAWASNLSTCQVILRNIGTTDMRVKFVQTTSVDPTVNPAGVRTFLASAFIPAGGFKKLSFTPSLPYLEMKGVSGAGELVVTMMSCINWVHGNINIKLEPMTLNYWISGLTAPRSTSASTKTTLAKSASQAFTSNTVWVVSHSLGFVSDITLLNATGVDITALATISAADTNGYTATFSGAQVGTAYSYRPDSNDPTVG